MSKNLCGKMVKAPYRENAYEVWETNGWTWYVLKKWQADDHQQYARWYCLVESPYTPEGEFGDTYAEEVMSIATRTR